MPGLSLAPVNFAAQAEQNPLMQIGQALAAFPAQQTQAEIQNQDLGKQLMAPYLKMIWANKDNEQNPSVMGPLNFLSKRYGVPIPMVTEDGAPAATTATPDATAHPQAAGAPPTPGGPPAAPTGAHPAAMSIGSPGPFGGNMAQGAGAPPQPPAPAAVAPGDPPPGAAAPGAPPPVPQEQQPPAPGVQHGGRMVIDPTWLMGMAINPDSIAKAQSMDPDQRKAFLQLQGVDPRWLPKNFLSAPQQITPAEKATATTNFARQIEGVAEGRNTVASITAIGNAYRPILGDAVVDSALNDPANLDKMGQGLVLQFDKYRQAGFWKAKDYDAAMARVNAAIGRNATYAEYVKMQEELLPHRSALMDAQTTHALAEAQAAHTRLAASAATSGLSRSQIASQYGQALRSYNQLQSSVGRSSYYKDPLTGRPQKTAPPDEILDAAQDAGSDLDYWTDQMREAGMPVKARDGYQSPTTPSNYQSPPSPASTTADKGLHKQGVQVVNPHTVLINGVKYNVGQIITLPDGKKAKVNADGSGTIVP